MIKYPSYLLVSSKRYRLESSYAGKLYRVPHDPERVDMNNGDYRYRPNAGLGGRGPVRQTIVSSGVARPEIYRANPDQTTPLGEAHQWLWRNLNPDLSPEKFCTLLGPGLAWTNDSGFPPRRNYILGRDLDNSLPNFHAPLVNGGQVLEGERVGDRVNIHSLLVGDPVPSVPEIFASRLWSWGISINPRGEANLIMRLGLDGINKPVRILWMTEEPVWLPADELHELAPGEMPEARWMFNN